MFLNILIYYTYFSDAQINRYAFYKFLLFPTNFPGKKIDAGTFLHPGSFDPGPMTRGARGHVGWPG
jgi:hypothetical protein